ncbi:phage major capsid protein [Bacillus xiapuensis]|uniref:Phage major capsid protein n=1 Tax=Bacillus xiapuensis TaxID=2014075 RepID=A0ABU6N931_9BACI|nr:phage major capsid protein [Bacillus xiapuensis]
MAKNHRANSRNAQKTQEWIDVMNINEMSEKARRELRFDLIDELDNILANAKQEKRNFTNKENRCIDEVKGLIAEIDQETLKEERGGMEMTTIRNFDIEKQQEEITKEERAFIDAIKGGEFRAVGLGVSSNGEIIPTSVANQVWNKIVQISPTVKMATHYGVKEQLQLPIHDFSTSYTVAFATEFSALAPNATVFSSVTLKNQIIGVLTKLGKSLVNMSGVDIL